MEDKWYLPPAYLKNSQANFFLDMERILITLFFFKIIFQKKLLLQLQPLFNKLLG